MSKVMNELQKLIETTQRKLDGLREEFDRLDANHPHQAIQVARDISEEASRLASLLEFQKQMKEGGIE
jgi:hypothetical protein